MTRPSINEFGRDQIMERVFDEDAKAIYTMPFGVAVDAGMFPNMQRRRKFGRILDVDTATVPEDIWTNGGVYGFLTAPTVLTISSEATTDNSAGTGGRTLRLDSALIAGYEATNIDVTLNGTTVVTISTNILRCTRLKVLTAGVTGFNDATVYLGYGTVASGVPVNIVALIEPLKGQTLMAIDTIPVGKTGYFDGLGSSINKASGATNRDVDLELLVREPDGAWQVKAHFGVVSNGNNPNEPNHAIPETGAPEKSDIRIRATRSSNDDTDISAWWSMILVNN